MMGTVFESEIACRKTKSNAKRVTALVFDVVKQPSEPGKKVYPAGCKLCAGKGWVKKPEK